MEVFIVGLAVVALMVFVSTKIKKSAAAAYEPRPSKPKNSQYSSLKDLSIH